MQDKEFQTAQEYADKILDGDPENSQAYLIKLLADLSITKIEDLANAKEVFNKNINFIRFSRYEKNEELKQEIMEYLKTVHVKLRKMDVEKKEEKRRIVKMVIILLLPILIYLFFNYIKTYENTERSYHNCKISEYGTRCTFDAYVYYNGADYGEDLVLSTTGSLTGDLVEIWDGDYKNKTGSNLAFGSKITVTGYKSSYSDESNVLSLYDAKITHLDTNSIRRPEPINIYEWSPEYDDLPYLSYVHINDAVVYNSDKYYIDGYYDYSIKVDYPNYDSYHGLSLITDQYLSIDERIGVYGYYKGGEIYPLSIIKK